MLNSQVSSVIQATEENLAPLCDCCGGSQWEYRFSENGFDLGRCIDCGLYYLSRMPPKKDRAGAGKGENAVNTRHAARARTCKSLEHGQKAKFRHLCRLVQRLAPPGKWLDIGCGQGALVAAAMELSIEIEGVEPMTSRREMARALTGAMIYDRAIEFLDFAPASFAAVTLTDVFSHLESPATALSCIHRILQSNGILLLYTSEIGAGVARHHNYSWSLGDHRYYLGEHTIERYAERIGYDVVYREKRWAPDLFYSRDNFLMKGRSVLRNIIKKWCVYTPGVLPAIRWYMLKVRHQGNPHYISTLLLRKLDAADQSTRTPAQDKAL